MYTITVPVRSIQAKSRMNRWTVSWLWIDASMSRVPLSGAPHGSGKVRLGFTYRITTLSILHSVQLDPLTVCLVQLRLIALLRAL